MRTVHKIRVMKRAGRVINMTQAAVESLVYNTQLQNLLPFIRYAHRQWNIPGKKRRCCGGKKNRVDGVKRSKMVDTVKYGLIRLEPTMLQQVKKILNVDQIIINTAELGRKEL